MKNICVIYGSPRKDGNSDKLGKAFVEGAKKNNIINEIFIRDLNIHGCLGCKYCYAHKGSCIQKDDMQKIYKILEETDVICFSTPIYYQSFPSQLKAFIDRLYVTENRNFNIRDSVLLATYASSDESMSKYIVSYFNILTKYHCWNNLGVITCSNLDEKNDIENNVILKDAYNLGKNI